MPNLIWYPPSPPSSPHLSLLPSPPSLLTPSLCQGEEHTVDYPSWAQFIGCVIVLTSVLCMPVYLIIRLICFESGRQEALKFIREQVSDGERLFAWLKELPRRTLSFLQSLRLGRQSWLRQEDEEEEEAVSSIPYSKANGSPVMSAYGTQSSRPAE